jgi:hypothetical protein
MVCGSHSADLSSRRAATLAAGTAHTFRRLLSTAATLAGGRWLLFCSSPTPARPPCAPPPAVSRPSCQCARAQRRPCACSHRDRSGLHRAGPRGFELDSTAVQNLVDKLMRRGQHVHVVVRAPSAAARSCRPHSPAQTLLTHLGPPADLRRSLGSQRCREGSQRGIAMTDVSLRARVQARRTPSCARWSRPSSPFWRRATPSWASPLRTSPGLWIATRTARTCWRESPAEPRRRWSSSTRQLPAVRALCMSPSDVRWAR